jgi:hypothetical protein
MGQKATNRIGYRHRKRLTISELGQKQPLTVAWIYTPKWTGIFMLFQPAFKKRASISKSAEVEGHRIPAGRHVASD